MGRLKMTNEQKIKFIQANIKRYIDKNPTKNTPLVEGWENFDDVKLQDLYIKVQNAQRDFEKAEMKKSFSNSVDFKNSKPMALFTDESSYDDLLAKQRELEKQQILIEQKMRTAIKEEIEKKQKQIQELNEDIERLKVELTKYE